MSQGYVSTGGPVGDLVDGWGAQPGAQQDANGNWVDFAQSGANGGVFDPLEDFDTTDGGGLSAGHIEVEGAYHLEVADAELKRDEGGNLDLNLNGRNYFNLRLVCLHSTPGQSPAGSTMWYELELPSAADATAVFPKSGQPVRPAVIRAFNTFLVGLGVFRVQAGPDGKEQIVDPATNSTKVQMATIAQRLKGRQFIGRPKRREWNANPEKGTKAGFRMEFPWGAGASQIGDPQNALVPIDEVAAQAGGYKKFKGTAAAAAPKGKAKAPAAAPPAANHAPAPPTGQAVQAPRQPAAPPAGQPVSGFEEL